LLLTSLGSGAVTGAVILSRIRQRLSTELIVSGSTVVFGIALLSLAHIRVFGFVCMAMFTAGGAWLTLLSSLNAAVQASVPSWVRARALSVYLLVFFGCFAGGSTIWGATATHIGIPKTFTVASLGLFIGLIGTMKYHLRDFEGLDLSPTKRWPAPTVADPIDLDQGPVLVTIEYRIDIGRARDFAEVMNAVRALRLRDGAIRWNLFKDTADPGRYLETFIVESWIEHLRQHERVTVADRELLDQVIAFQAGDKPPVVSHFIAERIPKS
jgi:hypothetical protein